MDRDAVFDRRMIIAGGLTTAALLTGTVVKAAASPPPAPRGTPTIFATGGGFFPAPGEKPLLPNYLLSLTDRKKPKICWLGAASGESPAGFEAFARGMEAFGCDVRHFSIFAPPTLDFVDYLRGMDIVFVGGGSSRNLMAMWREWKFDVALRQAWQAGVIMSGGSAGMICWFEGGLTDSYKPVLGPVRATGILPGSADPHYNIRPDRKTRFRELIASGALPGPGLALDQDVGVLYRGRQRAEIVSSDPHGGAYLLTRKPGGYTETPLPVRYLGA